jgi:hypothetical protein
LIVISNESKKKGAIVKLNRTTIRKLIIESLHEQFKPDNDSHTSGTPAEIAAQKKTKEDDSEPGETVLAPVDRAGNEGIEVIDALTKAIKAAGGKETILGEMFKTLRARIRKSSDAKQKLPLKDKDIFEPVRHLSRMFGIDTKMSRTQALETDAVNDDENKAMALENMSDENFKIMQKAFVLARKELLDINTAMESHRAKKEKDKQDAQSALKKYTNVQTKEEMVKQIQKTIDEKGIPEWKEIYSGGGASGWSNTKWKEFLTTARQKGLVSQSIADEAAKSWPKAAKQLGMKGNLKGAEELYQIIASGDSKLKDKTIAEGFKINRRTIRNLILQEIKRTGEI